MLKALGVQTTHVDFRSRIGGEKCHGRKFGYIGGGFTKGLKNEIKFKNTMGSIL